MPKSNRTDRFGDDSLEYLKVTPKAKPTKGKPQPKAGDQPKRKA